MLSSKFRVVAVKYYQRILENIEKKLADRRIVTDNRSCQTDTAIALHQAKVNLDGRNKPTVTLAPNPEEDMIDSEDQLTYTALKEDQSNGEIINNLTKVTRVWASSLKTTLW